MATTARTTGKDDNDSKDNDSKDNDDSKDDSDVGKDDKNDGGNDNSGGGGGGGGEISGQVGGVARSVACGMVGGYLCFLPMVAWCLHTVGIEQKHLGINLGRRVIHTSPGAPSICPRCHGFFFLRGMSPSGKWSYCWHASLWAILILSHVTSFVLIYACHPYCL
jgi:hypothetical protein